MSVILKDKDQKVLLITKGADNIMLPRLIKLDESILQKTNTSL